MSIKVYYFASLKEHVGSSEHELDFTQSLTVKDVWFQANAELVLPKNTLAAINMDYVEWDSLVSDGDVVAFFPPVTGG
jgi:molybdopterin synthase sulfur carrier subunit